MRTNEREVDYMRAVVNVATGSYVKGQQRLFAALDRKAAARFFWTHELPHGCPTHREVPYAFKAYALKQVADQGATTLLWCDACIVPVKPLEPLFERIERDGYWIGNNGYTNYEWTADAAYPDLFTPNLMLSFQVERAARKLEEISGNELAREVNRTIPHVVATAFGISTAHPTGRAILDEYYRLASTTKVFCGPWWNELHPDCPGHHEGNDRFARFSRADVRGHRHDQTALSVIAWRTGCQLTNSPDIFSYKGGEDERTVLVADGAY